MEKMYLDNGATGAILPQGCLTHGSIPLQTKIFNPLTGFMNFTAFVTCCTSWVVPCSFIVCQNMHLYSNLTFIVIRNIRISIRTFIIYNDLLVLHKQDLKLNLKI